MTDQSDPRAADAGAERAAAAAAMRRLRDAAGGLLATLTESQPIAPHHLLALRAVHEGARTASDVATTTNRHVSSVSRVIDQLVEDALVDRATDPEDRRQVLLTLTGEGQAAVERFERLDHMLSTRLLAEFDAEDARRLEGYLDRIAATARTVADELEDGLDGGIDGAINDPA